MQFLANMMQNKKVIQYKQEEIIEAFWFVTNKGTHREPIKRVV